MEYLWGALGGSPAPRRRARPLVGALVTCALLAGAPTQGRPQASGAPNASGYQGLFQVGPVQVTPTLRVGQVGYDSNVLYTATDRTGDFVADGGPGLELVLPLGSRFELGAGGGGNFLYFAETESQRRTTWLADTFVQFRGARTGASVSASYEEIFRRPAFEVNDRVEEVRRSAAMRISRRIGRNELQASLDATRSELAENQFFAGADLARNLSRSTYRAVLGFRLGLTPKTALVLEGDHQVDDFLEEPARDTDSNRIYGGFQIASTTRLSGAGLAGARSLRSSETRRWFPYVRVGLTYRLGPKTALAFRLDRDQHFSAFVAESGTQTAKQFRSELALGRRLWGPVEIRLFGGMSQLETDGAVNLALGGNESSGVRSDDEWYGGANLGIRIRNWFRIGLEARWADRNSTFDDFGVEGLLLGVTVTATPGDIVDLVAR